MNSTINIARFNKFVDKHGIWVIYARGNQFVACSSCGQTDRSEGDASCSECLGTGHPVELERMHVVIAKTRIGSLPELSKIPGFVVDSDYRLYTPRISRPAISDLILEVEWDTPQKGVVNCGQPVSIIHAYRIENVEPIYNAGIVFFAAAGDLIDHNIPDLTKSIFSR